LKTVGQLKAILGLDKKKYSQGLKTARKEGDTFGKNMKKLGGIIAGFFAFSKLFGGIKKLIQKNAEFGQSLADLSAITGATGKDLKFYEQQARRIGSSTTLAASEAVKAFELMGSARPELLKNKEALAAVTEQAVILAEAAGMELPLATQALAKAMNQFNIPASEAARVINVLAAGSKEGAEAIPGLTEAIKWMGTAASMAGVSLEESVGLIETLAEKGLSGAESGTQLRNVILKLQSEADRFNPKIVGMTRALQNLGRENLSTAQLTEMFGLRNQQAAAILISNIGKFENYTKAVTGTNVAYEQQAVKVDTVKGKWKALLSVIEANVLQGQGFRDKMKNALETAADGVPKVINGFRDIRNAVAGVINYFIDLYNESIAIRYVVQTIGIAWKATFGFVKVLIDNTVNAFRGLGTVIKDVFTGNWDAIKDHAKEAGQAIVEDWTDYADNMGKEWEDAMEKATSKEHVQLIKIKTVRSGAGAAPTPSGEGTTQRGGAGGVLPYTIPTETIAGIQTATVAIDRMNESIERGKEKFKELTIEAFGSNIALELFTGMADSMADAFLESEDKLKAFGKFFGDFIKRMIARFIAATIAAAALAAVMTIITGGGSGAMSFGKIFKGNFFKSFKDITGMAQGGVVPGGFPGDTFPALLTSGETVLPANSNLGGNNNMEIIIKTDITRGEDIYWVVEEVKRKQGNSF